MTEAQAQRIFEKYNPSSAITRCPNGRAPVRKLLDDYAKAAVNLYGIISLDEFAVIFNDQNSEHTNADEIFTLLLPIVLKSKNPWYCFYKGYIVHYWAICDFDYAEYLMKVQADKPRFIPPIDEFVKFENEYYESQEQESCWNKLGEFINKEWSDNIKRYRFFNQLKEIPEFSTGIDKISNLLEENGLVFRGEKSMQEFFDRFMEARNNTKLRMNKGYSPSELQKNMDKNRPKDEANRIVVQERRKIGRNDRCPCGSGKKYKKCCRLIEESRSAQLSTSECMLFYETWYGLMGFINDRKKVINARIKPIYPNPLSDEQVYKVRQVLWENPALIDDYLEAVKLPEEKTKLLKSWRDHHKKGMFFLVDYKPEYAVIIGSNEQKEDRLYGIKGISRSLADAMQRELPIQLETVLLPFKDKIIYDSFMSSMPIKFAEGAKKALREMYETSLEHGVIIKLD